MILLPGVTQLPAPLQEAQSPPRAAGLGARRLLYLYLRLTPIAFSKPLVNQFHGEDRNQLSPSPAV